MFQGFVSAMIKEFFSLDVVPCCRNQKPEMTSPLICYPKLKALYILFSRLIPTLDASPVKSALRDQNS